MALTHLTPDQVMALPARDMMRYYLMARERNARRFIETAVAVEFGTAKKTEVLEAFVDVDRDVLRRHLETMERQAAKARHSEARAQMRSLITRLGI